MFNLAQSLGLKSRVVKCSHCGVLHFDKDSFVNKHLLHKCLSCGMLFNSSDCSGMTVGNPLADVFNDLRKI